MQATEWPTTIGRSALSAAAIADATWSSNVDTVDTWTERDWLDFHWFGVCQCGRLRHEHAVFDDAGVLTDLTAPCDAGHEGDLDDIS